MYRNYVARSVQLCTCCADLDKIISRNAVHDFPIMALSQLQLTDAILIETDAISNQTMFLFQWFSMHSQVAEI